MGAHRQERTKKPKKRLTWERSRMPKNYIMDTVRIHSEIVEQHPTTQYDNPIRFGGFTPVTLETADAASSAIHVLTTSRETKFAKTCKNSANTS